MVLLDKANISSFCGDICCLELTDDQIDLTQAEIKWRVDGTAVRLRTFEKDEHGFRNGVLLVLEKEGSARVIATFEGQDYVCTVMVNPRRQAKPEETLQYYVGDFHVHTTMDHNPKTFAVRQCDFPADIIRAVREEGVLDFSVLSDHAEVTNVADFFDGFKAVENSETAICFAGAESEVNDIYPDNYGINHKFSGEIVTMNSEDYAITTSWAEFEQRVCRSPLPIASFAHPQVMGFDENGIWDFDFYSKKHDFLKSCARMIEMGNGTERETTLLFEYSYSVALDCGFRVSPCSTSDHHGPGYSSKAWPGKTIIMAPEKTKELFLDAILSNRVYACQKGNVRLQYTVNGFGPGSDLPQTEFYCFQVSADHLDGTTAPELCRCEIFSDFGEKLLTVEHPDIRGFSFTIRSNTARYFYLRITDVEHFKTWSAPVFTGRDYEDFSYRNELRPLDKKNVTAKEESTDTDVSVLVNGNPRIVWESGLESASLLFDLQTAQLLCGLGHYAPHWTMKELRNRGGNMTQMSAGFASSYRISVSTDGEKFIPCKEGVMRVFGSEELLTFAPCTARFVRLELLSTVGKASGFAEYVNAKLSVGEIDFLTK